MMNDNQLRLGFLLTVIASLISWGCTNFLSNQPQEQKQENASSTEPQRHEDLDAILWVQTSGEYQAITRQTYRLAELALKDAMGEPDWTASMEQQKLVDEGELRLADLKPAVVFDVDETVLSNAGYQVGLVESESDYSRESWKAYVTGKTSTPIAGAVEFVQTCRDAGVQPIFVTNREHEVESSTRENLIAVGLMKESDPDLIYSKYEKKEWKSDKISRRNELAKQYRILLLIGDDLHDFASTGHHPTSEQRRNLVENNPGWWGKKWIVLPNPNYGGWEQSLYDWNNSSSPATKIRKKRTYLND
jgi:acid phosphatase